MLLVSSIAVTELGAALLYLAATGEWMSYERLDEHRRARARLPGPPIGAAARSPADARRVEQEVVHPFVGYVREPRSNEQESLPFPFAGPLFEPPSPDRLVVLVVGGSVAGQLDEDAPAPSMFSASLAPAAAGREVVVVNLAYGGYKQPQQLALLAYLLSLGAHADVVVNLDGFNEVVLPWVDNSAAGVYPLYPRQWNLRLTESSEVDQLRAIGGIAAWRDVRAALAGGLGARPWRWSATANAAWFFLDRRLGVELDRHQAALRSMAARRSYQRLGPRQSPDRARTLALSVDAWERSSLAMHHLASGAGIVYVHLLHPNQYLDGSKPLSRKERRSFYQPSSSYGSAARDGLPLMRARGERLRAAGVRFHDLTQLFAHERRTVYSDECCHLDALGRELLAAGVGRAVAGALRAPADAFDGRNDGRMSRPAPLSGQAPAAPRVRRP